MALDSFFHFVSDFKSVAGLVGKAAILAPFIGILLNIGPPWPSGEAVSTLTVIVEVFVLIYIFQFFRSISKRRLEGRLKLFFILTVLCFIMYISVYSVYVFKIPNDGRVSKGFILLPLFKSSFLENLLMKMML